MTKVYVKTITDKRYITAVNSSAFLSDITDWIQIDEGSGDRYTHAQGNYFDKPIITDSEAYQYRLDGDDKPIECTTEEIAEQEAATTETAMPTTEDRLEALEAAMLDMILGGAV